MNWFLGLLCLQLFTETPKGDNKRKFTKEEEAFLLSFMRGMVLVIYAFLYVCWYQRISTNLESV